MRTIIAGGRDIDDYDLLLYAIHRIPFKITTVISGHAKGADTLGERFAIETSKPLETFPADWKDINHPDAIIRKTRNGHMYDASAGHRRNLKMITEGKAEALIALWDGESTGTKDMIQLAKDFYLKEIFILRV